MTDIDEVRDELNTWLDLNWNPNRSLNEWREILVEAKWAAVSWPRDLYGRDYDEHLSSAVQSVFAERNIVGAARAGPGFLIAETLLKHGSEDQKRRFLRPVLTGEHVWCQLFSEPGSGSDLAGATTRAEFRDGNWILNGQKVWTTSAHHADYGFILARTDWDVPKHQGLSYFLMDMHQPGVEVRPLKQMNGHASFNEVFITDAEISAENLVLTEGDGWQVATTTLRIERQGFAQAKAIAAAKRTSQSEQLLGTIHKEYDAEQEIALEPYKWYPQRTGRVDLILSRAIETGKINDPVVRQEMAKLFSMQKAAQFAARMVRESAQSGGSAFAPIGKLSTSMIARQAAKTHAMISDTEVLVSGAESPLSGVISEVLLSVPAISIAGGTDEIQRNIIAERILGLPKEPRFDTGPFRNVRRG